MRQIDYYMSVVSPWTYLCGNRPVEVAAKHDATLVYKPVDPMALFARTGGLPLGQRHESRQEYRFQELRRQSAKLGMPLTLKPAFFPTNPAPAAYAIIAAQEAGGGDLHKLVQSLCAACWANEQNVAEDEVIQACLVDAGFSANLTMSGLMTGADTYARNLEHAILAGVFGVPFFITGTEKFWGQDRIDDLDRHLSGEF
ncbi:MAG: 2-hydroxychromene-2-carboxylate isomerase [Rhodobacteraceae bacterium]|nr:2-hydroxychromene-2-carboxylate isomerase [Paracoccaceae bacterium]